MRNLRDKSFQPGAQQPPLASSGVLARSPEAAPIKICFDYGPMLVGAGALRRALELQLASRKCAPLIAVKCFVGLRLDNLINLRAMAYLLRRLAQNGERLLTSFALLRKTDRRAC